MTLKPIHLNSGDILRVLMVALLSILAWIGKDIYTQQAKIAERLRVVELNQAKMMGVMGIEPCTQAETQLHLALDLPP